MFNLKQGLIIILASTILFICGTQAVLYFNQKTKIIYDFDKIEKYMTNGLLIIFFFLIFYVLAIKIFYNSYRNNKLRELASKLKLEYKSSDKRRWFSSVNYYPLRVNILNGEIGKNRVIIYDYQEIATVGFSDPCWTYKKESTIIRINGKSRKLRGFIGGRCSVKTIENIINELK